MATNPATNSQNQIDLSREIAQVRNSKAQGANWLAQALQKIETTIKQLQKGGA